MMELLLIFLLILVMVLVTILIITRSKAQRILLQLTRDQSTIQQATRIGSWEWDIPNNIIRFSQTGLEILGFDADTPSVPDAQFISRIYQPDRKAYINTLKKALKNQETFIGEFRCDMNKPFKRWFMSRGEVITDKNDIPVKVVGMHHDSTKTVIMRTLQMAINDIQQDIIRHEPLNTILSRICSTTQEIEPSIHCVIFLAKDDKTPLQLHHSQNIPQPLLQILNSITLVDENSELIQTLNNSDILYIEQLNELSCWKSANQIHNTLGLNAYYGQQIVNNQWNAKSVLCLYLQDNSIPVEIIHQMIESITGVISVAIEGQIQTDKKQKIQLQLYHSQKMESLGHLTSGIAHDFNNILGSIVGYNSLAKKLALKTGDKKLLSFISEVNTASERARDLISQMMIFSRSEPSKNRSVEVQPVIKEVLQLIKSMIPSSITINHQFEKELKKIQINPIALHQVILNLMVNAKDAISEQLGEITVRSYQSLQKRAKCLSCHKNFSGNYLCIEVTDTGSGIPSELMERIFDPFFTTKNIGRGTGMGLSVVHRILHDVNAHICGSSNPVKGTTLRLYFPPDSTPEDGLDNNNKLTTENSGPIGHGEHIMVVDDDIPLSLLYEEILTGYCYKVSRFDNSQVALEHFLEQQNKFSLILSDQTIPFMTGEEMARQMLSKRPDIPIIICTGYSEVLNEEKACEMGIKAILKKPVDMYQLLELIDETLHANV
ncbi:MAG: response regulator [Gammaproteobacteria bacterium]|nr:response regulator [Gammaproteobacteria bacterium]